MSAGVEEGLYSNPFGDQTLSVHGDQLTVHLELIGSRSGQMFDRTYRFRVLTGGELQPYPVRSVDGVFGIGQFKFVWDGSHIVQRERATDIVIQEFTRR